MAITNSSKSIGGSMSRYAPTGSETDIHFIKYRDASTPSEQSLRDVRDVF